MEKLFTKQKRRQHKSKAMRAVFVCVLYGKRLLEARRQLAH